MTCVGAVVLVAIGVAIFFTHSGKVNPSAATVWASILLMGVVSVVVGTILRSSDSSIAVKSRAGLVILISGAIVTVLMSIFAGLLLFVPDEDNTASHLKNFTVEEQRQRAQEIVDGLNTHDIAQVPIPRGGGHGDPGELALATTQDETVRPVLPASGCRYVLRSVDDEGEQGTKIIPGLVKESRVYLLGLNVDEQCPGVPPLSRTLGLYLIPYWGYWTPLSFSN